MNYVFPEWVVPNYTSLIRGVTERGAAIPGFISFALGNPATEAIPTEAIAAAAREILDDRAALMTALKYGPSTGYPPLLEQTIDWLQNVKKYPQEGQMLVLLPGSAQGLGLIPMILCQPGDTVFCDEFAFPNFINSARYAGCRVVGVAMDERGMIPEALAEAAAKTPGKLLYVNPNFQNPTGATLPLERRRQIYEIACRWNLVLYEDDPYGDIRFRGTSISSFKEMDTENRVIFAGSYSKTLSAGLRVGYLYGGKDLLGTVQKVKNNQLGQNPLLNQMIISKTLERLDFPAHLSAISRIYGEKCAIMTQALKKYGPEDMKILVPDGGMFTWVVFPDSVNCGEIFRRQFEAGVGAVPSYGFAVDAGIPWHAFRLNYTYPTGEQLETGVERFGTLCRAVAAICS